jgi:hypothetical protein
MATLFSVSRAKRTISIAQIGVEYNRRSLRNKIDLVPLRKMTD